MSWANCSQRALSKVGMSVDLRLLREKSEEKDLDCWTKRLVARIREA